MRTTKRVRRKTTAADPAPATPINDDLQRRIDALIERAWEGLERLIDECKPAEVIRLLV